MYQELKLKPINFDQMSLDQLLIRLEKENITIERCQARISVISDNEWDIYKFTLPEQLTIQESYTQAIIIENTYIEEATKNIFEITKLISTVQKPIQLRPNFHQIRKGYSN